MNTTTKVVWEERVTAKNEYQRRIVIEERTIGKTPEYRVLAAACHIDCTAPAFSPRSEWKKSYAEARVIGGLVYDWACGYARKNGFATPDELVKASCTK